MAQRTHQAFCRNCVVVLDKSKTELTTIEGNRTRFGQVKLPVELIQKRSRLASFSLVVFLRSSAGVSKVSFPAVFPVGKAVEKNRLLTLI